MDWKEWMGKRIFVKLNGGGIYSGEVVDIDSDLKPLIFITIIDKFGQRVQFLNSEILKIKEEV